MRVPTPKVSYGYAEAVALLFTDIEGSTQRWERFGDAMGEAVRRHDALLRHAIESHGGRVFKTVGDAFYAAFSTVQNAVEAALFSQRALAEEDFSAVDGLRVRMAVHSGICEERDGDYFGPALNRVARLISVGHGGQILLSEAAVEQMRLQLPPGASLIALGTHRLKDLSAPERVSCLTAPGLRADFPPLRSLSTMPNNLPQQLTPIIGRDRDVVAVETMLRSSQLVSIVAMGGIGKTRVALQVGADLLDAEGDGVWFVDLAPLSEPSLVASSIANVIGLVLPPNQDAATALAATLRPLNMLVVLDNCEHLIDAAARLAEMLVRSCPRLTILATSREPLAVSGELVYRLEALEEASAKTLFLARAQQADQRFTLAPGDEDLVAEICRRLDRIALAIELAAARVHLMSLKALLKQLNDRFRLLRSNNRTALPRQQTLRALIDWSYDLLSEEERAVFRRLGVFAGGFSTDAAGRVCGNDRLDAQDVLVTLLGLVDKSVVARVIGEEQRYRMLESIREYAVERLREAGEDHGFRRAHAAYYAALSVEVHESYGRDAQETWLARYEPDLDNFRSAFEWAVCNDVALAAVMGGNLPEFWHYSNLVAEGLRRTEAALEALGPHADERDSLPLLIAIGSLADGTHSFRRSLEIGERALEIAARAGDELAVARARRITGWSRYVLGEDPERGRDELQLAADFFRAQDNPLRTSSALAACAHVLGPADGLGLLEEAATLVHAARWPRLSSVIDINLAEWEFADGDPARAADRVRAMIGTLRGRRAPLDLAGALRNFASYLSVMGEYDEALAAAREAADIALTHEDISGVAIAVQSRAIALADREDARSAARILGYVNEAYNRHGSKRERTEELVQARLLCLLHARLDDTTLESEVSAGRKLSEFEVCTLAFDENFVRLS
jgi:predicted ATPase/class 3 adenylate cyclase